MNLPLEEWSFWDGKGDWTAWLQKKLSLRMAITNAHGLPLTILVNRERHGDVIEPGETRDFVVPGAWTPLLS